MENSDILGILEQSDMVLVGLGEEFDDVKRLRQRKKYAEGCSVLKQEGLSWMIPAWNEFWAEDDNRVDSALEKLKSLLQGKNCFAVSVSTNRQIKARWGQERIVMPCGSASMKQCGGGCGEALREVTDEDRERLNIVFRELAEGHLPEEGGVCLGLCPNCGEPLVLNNVFAEKYDESGYLEQWKLYMKWLQGTLNHRLLVLELGVGMSFPTVIRWPFEKTAFFNKKAFFCRVNEELYQLAEGMSEKGKGILSNAIDWTLRL